VSYAPPVAFPLTAYIPGKYYGNPWIGAPGLITPGNGTLDTSLFICERPVSIDRIAAYVATGAGGSELRFGIYKGDGANHVPSTLFTEFATRPSAATSGVKEVVIDPALTLPRGIWWLACATQGGAPNMRQFTCASPFVGGDNTNWLIGGGGFPSAWTVTGVAGALPNPLESAGALQGLASPVAIVVRVA
jgi:hypothetical protein